MDKVMVLTVVNLSNSQNSSDNIELKNNLQKEVGPLLTASNSFSAT